jgi:mannose-6-phosphate isomerase-like protein (cupin superfamily)
MLHVECCTFPIGDTCIVTTIPEPRVIGLDEGEALWLLGDLYEIRARNDDTGGAYSVTECTIAPHAPGPPPHRHGNESEGFYVIEGTIEALVGDRRVRAEAGSFAFVPPGTTHTYSNPTDQPARILVILSPGGFEGFWSEFGEQSARRELPPPPDGPPNIDRLLELGERYALEVDLPPQP